jgi:hypothetical protein
LSGLWLIDGNIAYIPVATVFRFLENSYSSAPESHATEPLGAPCGPPVDSSPEGGPDQHLAPRIQPAQPGSDVVVPSGMHCPPLDSAGRSMTHYKWPLRVEMEVDEQGRVTDARNPDHRADFEPILSWAKKCTFDRPGTHLGEPVGATATISFEPGDLSQPAQEPPTASQRPRYLLAARRIGQILLRNDVRTAVEVDARFEDDCRVESLEIRASDGAPLPKGEVRQKLEAEVRNELEALGQEACPPAREFRASYAAPTVERGPR